MKKNISLLLLLCLGWYAQGQIGIRTGMAINDFKYDQDPGFSSKSIGSPFAGLFVEAELSTATGLRAELNYMTQGTKVDILGTTIEYNLNYLELPVLFQFKTKPGLKFHLGPSLGYALSAKAKTGQQKEDFKDLMNDINLEGNLGINYATPFGLELEIRYHMGFMNVSRDDTNKITTQGISFGLGYFFK